MQQAPQVGERGVLPFMLQETGKKIRQLIVPVVILWFLLFLGVTAAHHTLLQQGIAEEVLRFHVLANSDREEDQAVKYLVRDEVLEWLNVQMEETTAGSEMDRETELQFLSAHLDEIESVADRVLAQNGFSYTAHAQLESCYFPARTYGDCTFPAGWYEALRILLGEGQGQNWWCVLYPRLCFTDCLHAVVEDEEMDKIKSVLTAEEYEYLLRSPDQWKLTFRWLPFIFS
jgi:stage II sporulation protein R